MLAALAFQSLESEPAIDFAKRALPLYRKPSRRTSEFRPTATSGKRAALPGVPQFQRVHRCL